MTVTVIALIGIVAWLAIVLFTLALLRAAARADAATERQQSSPLAPHMPEPPAHRPEDGRGFTRRVRQRLQRLDRQPDAILGVMIDMAARDPAATAHAAAVAHYARALARAAGLPEREQGRVHTAGLLHDIGLLMHLDDRPAAHHTQEPDPRIIAAHPGEGARLLRSIPALRALGDIIEAHHERIDGTGYPHGLPGEQIPRQARILAIAEVYDTLSAPDSYRSGLDDLSVRSELRRAAGGQLDHELVQVFLQSVVPHDGSQPKRPRLEHQLPALPSAQR